MKVTQILKCVSFVEIFSISINVHFYFRNLPKANGEKSWNIRLVTVCDHMRSSPHNITHIIFITIDVINDETFCLAFVRSHIFVVQWTEDVDLIVFMKRPSSIHIYDVVRVINSKSEIEENKACFKVVVSVRHALYNLQIHTSFTFAI